MQSDRVLGRPLPHPGSKAHLRIGGITLALAAADPGLRLHLDGAMTRFQIPAGRPRIDLTVILKTILPVTSRPLFDSGGVWRLYREQGRHRFDFTSPRYGDLPYKTAVLDRDFAIGEISLHSACFDPSESHNPLEYPLDELLVLLVLARKQGAEIHACGAVDPRGRGYLFAGQSGAGKTTLARLWQGLDGGRVLSDDRVILRYEDDGFWIYGTPWHGEGEFAVPDRVPLHRVLFLRHGPQNDTVAKTGAEAVALLYACTFLIPYEAAAPRATLALFERLVSRIPCQELHFVADPHLLPFLLG